jgi:hypothetical protein
MPDIWNCREVYRGLGNKRAFKNPVVLGRGVKFFFFWAPQAAVVALWAKRGSSDFLGKKRQEAGWQEVEELQKNARRRQEEKGLDLSACAAEGCL